MSWLNRSFVKSLRIVDEEDVVNDHKIRRHRDGGDRSGITRSNDQSLSSMHGAPRRDHPQEEAANGADDDEGGGDGDQSHGVKEDFTELKQTLTRQFRGVANFLSPPPQPPPPPPPPRSASNPIHSPVDHPADNLPVDDRGRSGSSCSSISCDDDNEVSFRDQIDGISGQLPKVGVEAGRGGGGMSAVSYDRGGSEDLRFNAGCDRLELEGEEESEWAGEAVGLTDEVLVFAGNIAHHPETWLDFPIEEEEEEDDLDDFIMSEVQKEHVREIERLLPSLRALRIEFCPVHMSVGYFWKVYFVLLHSRLSKHDADLLSTSQVVEARAQWMKELQKRTKEEMEKHHHNKESAYLQHDDYPSSPQIWASSEDSPHHWTFASAPSTSTGDSDGEKHQILSGNAKVINKSVVGEEEEEKQVVKVGDRYYAVDSSPKVPHDNFGVGRDDEEEEDDVWPEDDFSDNGNNAITIPVGIEEDVSFSDLEDDDCSLHVKYNMGTRV